MRYNISMYMSFMQDAYGAISNVQKTLNVLKERCHISRIFSFLFFLSFYKFLMDLF